jgi:flagellar biogenesis protein FliO
VIEIENQRLLIGVTKENMTILTCLEPVSTLDEALQEISK